MFTCNCAKKILIIGVSIKGIPISLLIKLIALIAGRKSGTQEWPGYMEPDEHAAKRAKRDACSGVFLN